MLAFAKGHGTLNDFVCFTDPDGDLALSDDRLRFLCDRRAGIGGDGTLRAVRARHVPGYERHGDAWFMDYRNADASIAEMCGNGLRVFLRYLAEEGLIDPDDETEVVTRAGLRSGTFVPGGDIRVGMGSPVVAQEQVEVTVAGRRYPAWTVDVGNPHAAAPVVRGELTGLDLSVEPGYPDAVFPNRANVEFFETIAPHHVAMRVWERGVGETFSCGTGTVAVARAAAAEAGEPGGTWRVDPPGGSLIVELTPGQAYLTGPAVIVARGKVNV